MAHIRHRLLAVTTLVLLFVPQVHHPARSIGSRTEISGATMDQLQLFKWSRAQFAGAGLPLPDLDVRFHQDRAGCDDANGRYRKRDHRLRMCNVGDMTTTPEHTMLHELGHAWSFEYLELETIQAFLELRDLEDWRDVEAWWLKGQEQAAEIVAWGLMGDRPFESRFTRWVPCEELSRAYLLLTGVAPTRPGVHCD